MINSALEKVEEEPLKISILGQLSRSIAALPPWYRGRSMGIKFFINCLIIIPICWLGLYLIWKIAFSEVSGSTFFYAFAAFGVGGLTASAALAR